MTTRTPYIRTAIGTAIVLLATSLATAYGSEMSSLGQKISTKQATLPGATTQVDPCGPKKVSSPLGY
jgi:hypothetical protein